MIQEEKELLLKDLSARLPYGVKVDLFGQSKELIGVLNDIISVGYDINDYEDAPIEDIKPYLRPISSMTEEERLYFHRNSARVQILVDEEKVITKPFYGYTIHLFDWLNSHHFDYRNLIEKNLALEAPENMYK